MFNLKMSEINSIISEFLEEAYDGPKNLSTWFINNEPNSGLLGTISTINSDEASTPILKNGTTVAAHVEHLRWSLNMINSQIKGENPQWLWSESWSIRNVNPDEWTKLVENLRNEYSQLIQTLSAGRVWISGESLKEILALIPHAAYHLGAIRQIVLVIKNKM